MRRFRTGVALATVATFVGTAFGVVGSPPVAAQAGSDESPSAAGSIRQAYVIDATPGQKLVLVRNGKTIATGKADNLGSKIFYDLKPGSGYEVRDDSGK